MLLAQGKCLFYSSFSVLNFVFVFLTFHKNHWHCYHVRQMEVPFTVGWSLSHNLYVCTDVRGEKNWSLKHFKATYKQTCQSTHWFSLSQLWELGWSNCWWIAWTCWVRNCTPTQAHKCSHFSPALSYTTFSCLTNYKHCFTTVKVSFW